MYFIKIKSFVFLGLSRCTNTLPMLKSSFISVLFFMIGMTGGSKSSGEANLSSGRCKSDTGEGNPCHSSSLCHMKVE